MPYRAVTHSTVHLAIAVIVLCAGFLVPPVFADSSSSEAPESADAPRRLTLGFNIDLFPIISSAAQGDFGFGGQVHVAIDRVQLRLIGAHLTNPDFTLEQNFQDYQTTVVAVVVDVFLRDEPSGLWGSTGFEIWLNDIGNSNTIERATWTNGVWTLGGGYVWRIGPHFFVNPWAGMHVRMNNPNVELGGQSFQPMPVVANASIKLGMYFDL